MSDPNQRVKPNRTFLYWSLTGILFFIGLLALLNLTHWEILSAEIKALVEKIVEAFLVACILAVSVDTFLKKQLAKDAFEASIGYILPEYLRNEISAIYSSQIICIDHSQTARIIPHAESDYVTLEVSVERELENISNSRATATPLLAVDEWLAPAGQSEIVAVGYAVNDNAECSYGPLIRGESEQAKLIRKSETISLEPGDKIRVWYAYREIKRRSDLNYLASSYATNKPRVRVVAPEEFGWAVEFTHRANVKKQKLTGEVILPGLLLPHQVTIIRWWDKAKANAWIQGITESPKKAVVKVETQSATAKANP